MLKRGWFRLLKALRVQFGSITLYSPRLSIFARTNNLKLERVYSLHSLPMLEEAATVVEPQVSPIQIAQADVLLNANVCDLEQDDAHDPDVIDVETAVEQEIQVGSYSSSLSTEARGLSFSESFATTVIKRQVQFSDSGIAIRRMLPPGTQTRLLSDKKYIYMTPLRRSATPMKYFSTQERINYWKQVLNSLQKPASQLKLVGIFRNVPRAGVKRAKVDTARGELKIWMDPAAKPNWSSGTLLVARDVQEKKIYQVYTSTKTER